MNNLDHKRLNDQKYQRQSGIVWGYVCFWVLAFGIATPIIVALWRLVWCFTIASCQPQKSYVPPLYQPAPVERTIY